jgi:hypothetical protein
VVAGRFVGFSHEHRKERSVRIALAGLAFQLAHPASWSADWAWSLPLIVFTVIIHVFGLLVINQRVEGISGEFRKRHSYPFVFVTIIGATALLATILHAGEAIIWALAYRSVNALPDNSSAILYSLNAITSYGHENLDLAKHWQLMGALEALNGMLLFGLTTAFLFAIIQKVWVLRDI